jgi:hypothetical protein
LARALLVQSEVVLPRAAGAAGAAATEAGADCRRDADGGAALLVRDATRSDSSLERPASAKDWPRAGVALGVCRITGFCASNRCATMLPDRAGASSCGR